MLDFSKLELEGFVWAKEDLFCHGAHEPSFLKDGCYEVIDLYANQVTLKNEFGQCHDINNHSDGWADKFTHEKPLNVEGINHRWAAMVTRFQLNTDIVGRFVDGRSFETKEEAVAACNTWVAGTESDGEAVVCLVVWK